MKAFVLGTFLLINTLNFSIDTSRSAGCWKDKCRELLNSDKNVANQDLQIIKSCSLLCENKQSCMKDCLVKHSENEINQLWKCGEAFNCLNELDTSGNENDICTLWHCMIPSNNCDLFPPCIQLYQKCDQACQKDKKCMVTCAQETENNWLIDLCNCVVANNCKF